MGFNGIIGQNDENLVFLIIKGDISPDGITNAIWLTETVIFTDVHTAHVAFFSSFACMGFLQVYFPPTAQNMHDMHVRLIDD